MWGWGVGGVPEFESGWVVRKGSPGNGALEGRELNDLEEPAGLGPRGRAFLAEGMANAKVLG